MASTSRILTRAKRPMQAIREPARPAIYRESLYFGQHRQAAYYGYGDKEQVILEGGPGDGVEEGGRAGDSAQAKDIAEEQAQLGEVLEVEDAEADDYHKL